MAIEHSDIGAGERHEPKGADSATTGQVYVADGAGSGAWTSPEGFATADMEFLLASKNTATQGPSALDTAHQIVFGAGSGTGSDPVQISGAGAVTCNETGQYRFNILLNFGRTGATGTSELLVRTLVDAADNFSESLYFKLDDADTVIPAVFSYDLDMTAGEVWTMEMIRDPSGNNSGSLIAFTPTTTASWSNASSASLQIYRHRIQ